MAACFIAESSAPTDHTQSPLFSDTPDLSTTSSSDKYQLIQIHQWISSISNINSLNTAIVAHLNTALGSVNNKENYIKIDNEILNELSKNQQSSDSFGRQIIFKIDKKVFVESIDFYEKATDEVSAVMRVEFEIKDERNRAKWITVYETNTAMSAQCEKQLFSPKLPATSFKTDTIRVWIYGDVKILDGIEITGSMYESDLQLQSAQSTINSSLLSRQIQLLISSSSFSDIIFEVEGKKIPAHRNILVCRSEYFRAMLNENSKFKEAATKNQINNVIYIGDITYNVFIQVLNFIYTGQIDLKHFQYNISVDVMRAADKMNLSELEELCLYHISLIINENNVCKIYKELHEKKPIMNNLLELCHDLILYKFAIVSKTDDFCSLPQELVIKIIENVVPKLTRVTSVQVSDENMPDMPNLHLSCNEEDDESSTESSSRN